MDSVYTHSKFSKSINIKDIDVIVECGSRDCLDAIEMLRFYHPEIIYSFECNPESIPVCKGNIRGYSDIVLIPKAVYNDNRQVVFFPTDMEKSIDKNIGASSLLWHRDNQNEFFQKRIVVEGIRLDSFMVQYKVGRIDLLCMDLQGAEYIAIEGLGERIADVNYIISEVTIKSHYIDDKSRLEFIRILRHKGFKLINYLSWNMLFQNTKYIKP